MKRDDEKLGVDRGENPGGHSELCSLLYPFHRRFPKKVWSKIRWALNARLEVFLAFLNQLRAPLTVVDRLGAPGDALLTAIVIRNLKQSFPKLKVNCITPHPELLKLDPAIDNLNSPENFFSFDSSYWDLVRRKDSSTNVVTHSLRKVGIVTCEYKARFYLSEQESQWGKAQTKGLRRPLFTLNAASKEPVKTWPVENWRKLLPDLLAMGDMVQLGDDGEPNLPGTHRMAGRLTIRESAAILAHADLHLGPDSLLMHVANGLDVPSVILMGGSRPATCLGYTENENLTATPPCSPCWIHQGHENCEYEVKCLHEISQERVLDSILMKLSSFQ